MTNEMDATMAGTEDDFLDVLGEAITYLPKGGGSRPIRAVINREGIEQRYTGTGTSNISITVANDSTKGISSSEFDSGGDKVTIRPRINDPETDKKIIKILNEDSSMITLEVN